MDWFSYGLFTGHIVLFAAILGAVLLGYIPFGPGVLG